MATPANRRPPFIYENPTGFFLVDQFGRPISTSGLGPDGKPLIGVSVQGGSAQQTQQTQLAQILTAIQETNEWLFRLIVALERQEILFGVLPNGVTDK